MTRKRTSRRTRRLFIFWSVMALLGSAFLLPPIWILARSVLLLPPVLANMVSGLVVGLSLGFSQQQIQRRLGFPLLPFWVSSSTFGGLLGGLLAGAGYIYLQSLTAFALPQAIPFIGIFAFIGLFQWAILHQETRHSPLWPLLMTLLGVVGLVVAQSAALLPLLLLLTVAWVAANRLHRWQETPIERPTFEETDWQPDTSRLRLPNAEAEYDAAPETEQASLRWKQQPMP